jgi:hypothetical protein
VGAVDSITTLTASSGSSTTLDLTRSAAGQWIAFDDGTDVWGLYNTAGSPEGVLTANIGALSMDTTNGTLYVKTTADGTNTDWTNLATGGSTEWTLSGTTVHPNSATTDVAVGVASDTLVAPFSVDVDTNTIRMGIGSGSNAVLNMFASDGDTGSVTYTTADEWNFTGGAINLDANSTTGVGLDLSADALTTGTALNITSTNTTFSSGSLLALDWTATGSITSTADLFTINVGTGETIASFLKITDDGSDVFKVTQSVITSAVPHEFTAAGDVSIAYDIQFTNQTASYIKSNAPLYLQAGESFESNNLTLQTFNSGNVVIDTNRLDMTTRATIGDVVDIDWAAATTQTGALAGIDLDFTNLTSVDGSTTYGVHVNDLAAQTTSTEYAIYQEGTNWDYGAVFADDIQIGRKTEFVPSSTQTLSAGDAIAVNATHLKVAGSGGAVTLTSTPTIADGIEGEFIIIRGADNTNTIEIQDEGTLGSSNLQLGSTTRVLGNGDSVGMIFDGTYWVELWFSGSIDADIAEWYKADEVVEHAEVVALSPSDPLKVVRATDSAGSRVVGISSARPAQIYGDQFGNEIQIPVALIGRVPVKVSSSSDAIEIGDLIGASSAPGLAQKVDSGYIIGRALETWTPGAGQESIKVFVNPIYVSPIQLTDSSVIPSVVEGSQSELEDRISQLELALFGIDSDPVTTYHEIQATDLTVLGDTILGDTVINGKLNIGTIQIDNTNNSIDAIGTLRIQELALGDIEFMGGLITFDTEGNIVANELTANKYSVAGASAGTSAIPAAGKEVFVETPAVAENSLVFITPKRALAFPLAVTSKEAGVGFWVSLPATQSLETEFDWWVIDSVDE